MGHSILLAEVSDGHTACRDNVELVKYTNTPFCIGQWAAHISIVNSHTQNFPPVPGAFSQAERAGQVSPCCLGFNVLLEAVFLSISQAFID